MTIPALVSQALLAALFAAGPAHAHESPSAEAPIEAAAHDFASSERWVLRSDALGEDVVVRIHRPVLGVGPSTLLLVAMLPPADVGRIVADLRQRELQSQIHGVVVVEIERVDPTRGAQPWVPRREDPIRTEVQSGLTRFLSEELQPLLRDELGLAGGAVVAGAGVSGRGVLQIAVEARGAFDEFVVVAPEPADVHAAARVGAGTGASSPTSNINLLASPVATEAFGPAVELWAEGPFYLELEPAPGQLTDASDYVRDRAVRLAIVRPH